MKKKKISVKAIRIIFLCIFVPLSFIFVRAAFSSFSENNNRCFIEQNKTYLKNLTELQAKAVERNFDEAMTNLHHQASVFAEISSTTEETYKMILDDINRAKLFDVMGFISDKKNVTTTVDYSSGTADSMLLISAMMGKSGAEYMQSDSCLNEPALVFYVPVMVDGAVRGVLFGAYTENSLNRLLSSDDTGISSGTVLMTLSGEVIAGVQEDGAEREQNGKYVIPQQNISEEDYSGISKFFRYSTEKDYSFRTARGEEHSYVNLKKLYDSRFVISLEMPEEVTEDLLSQLNKTAFQAEAELILLFFLLISVIGIQSLIEKKKLKNAIAYATSFLESVIDSGNATARKNEELIEKLKSNVKMPLRTIISISDATREVLDETETVMAGIQEISASEELILEVVEDASSFRSKKGMNSEIEFSSVNLSASVKRILSDMKIRLDARGQNIKYTEKNISNANVLVIKERFANMFAQFISDTMRKAPYGSNLDVTLIQKDANAEGISEFCLRITDSSVNEIKKLLDKISDKDNMEEVQEPFVDPANVSTGAKIIYDVVKNFGYSIYTRSYAGKNIGLDIGVFLFSDDEKNRQMLRQSVV